MSPATVFSIAIRLTALYLGVIALVSLPVLGMSIQNYLERTDPLRSVWVIISPAAGIVLSLIGVFIFYRSADRIAAAAYREAATPGPPGMTHRDWLRLAVQVVGIVCIAFAIPNLAGQGIQIRALGVSLTGMFYGQVLPGLVQAIIGLLLIRNAERVADMTVRFSTTSCSPSQSGP